MRQECLQAGEGAQEGLHQAADTRRGRWWLVAETVAIAIACLGDNHLWQDLQLPSRNELSALMLHWFPALKARNSGDMKWKKFLCKQLCAREEIQVCKAPSCAVCSDQPPCFGPETG